MSESEKGGGTRLSALLMYLVYHKLLVMVQFDVTFISGHVSQECLPAVRENIHDRCFSH